MGVTGTGHHIWSHGFWGSKFTSSHCAERALLCEPASWLKHIIIVQNCILFLCVSFHVSENAMCVQAFKEAIRLGSCGDKPSDVGAGNWTQELCKEARRGSDPAVTSPLMWVLWTEPRSSAKAASAPAAEPSLQSQDLKIIGVMAILDCQLDYTWN